jgi:hypothetical protein
MTNRGLQIELPLIQLDALLCIAILQCANKSAGKALLGLVLERRDVSDSRFERSGGQRRGIIEISQHRARSAIPQSIYTAQVTLSDLPKERDTEVRLILHGSYTCVRCYPPEAIEKSTGQGKQSFTIKPHMPRAFFIFANDLERVGKPSTAHSYVVALFDAPPSYHDRAVCRTISLEVPVAGPSPAIPSVLEEAKRLARIIGLSLPQLHFRKLLVTYIMGEGDFRAKERPGPSFTLIRRLPAGQTIDRLFGSFLSYRCPTSFEYLGNDCSIAVEVKSHFQRGKPKGEWEVAIGQTSKRINGPYELDTKDTEVAAQQRGLARTHTETLEHASAALAYGLPDMESTYLPNEQRLVR